MDKKLEIQENQYEQPYHWMLTKNIKTLYELRTELVLNLIKPLNKKKCLDVGCGDGKFTSALVACGALEITAVDFSEKALRFARCLVPDVLFLKMDYTNMHLRDHYFDIVTCLDVLEHLPSDKIYCAINEMVRVLKRKGILIVSVPSKNIKTGKTHYSHYDQKELRTILQEKFCEISLIGCGKHILVLDNVMNYPKIWKFIKKLIVKQVDPSKALTLIAKAQKFDLKDF